jgi:hypothetical protein
MAHPAKTCGGCTLCCKVLTVREIDKAQDVWCGHCNVGVGCRIYAERPPSCRDFECLWLQAPPDMLDASLRPDRSKVVFTKAATGELVARCDPSRPDAWTRPKIMETLREFARRNGHSLVFVGERIWVVTPSQIREVSKANLVRKGDGTSVFVPYVAGEPALDLMA